MTTQQTVISSAPAKRTNVHGLAWKEWNENKILAIWPVPLLVIFFFALVSIQNMSRHGRPLQIEFHLNMILMAIVWSLSALVCGASIYSQELGNGTGLFLASLPFSKRRIWATKVLCGFLQHVAAVILAALTTILLYFIAERLGILDSNSAPTKILTNADISDFVNLVLLPTITFYAFAACVTFVIDRPINTVMISLIVSAVAYAEYSQMYYRRRWISADQHLPLALLLIITALLFGISYLLYARPENLKELRVSLVPILVSWLNGLAVVVITLIFCYFWLTS